MTRENAIQQIDKLVDSVDLNENEKMHQIEEVIALSGNDLDVKLRYIDALFQALTSDSHRYNNLKDKRDSKHFKKLEEQCRGLHELSFLLLAFIDFLNDKKDKAMRNIDMWFKASDKKIEYSNILDLLITFKQGFKEMWNDIGKIVRSLNAEPGLESACYAIESFYYSSQLEPTIDAFTKVLVENDKIHLAKELIGFTYYSMHMWENAIAYFEQALEIDPNDASFTEEELCFYLGWSYGRIKDFKSAETYYKRLLDLDPTAPSALNNLGYCLFKQKKYAEAKSVFEQCIAKNNDLRMAVNNKFRLLIEIGEYNEAKKFAEDNNNIISKDLLNRSMQVRKGKSKPEKFIDTSTDDVQMAQAPKGISIEKGMQFSSEKILEDELTHRIERGDICFGVPLSVYKQKGKYGRQYIMPVGRVDILASDAEENLYVIELKKDSGYGDVYNQVNRYVMWIEKNIQKPGKKVYGIIVVNNPSDELVLQVRSNPQLRLYDYSIMYREIS